MSAPPAVGLCIACVHQQVVRTTRGSVFSLCRRSREDPAYPRYPRLPVLRCEGFDERLEEPEDPDDPAPLSEASR